MRIASPFLVNQQTEMKAGLSGKVGTFVIYKTTPSGDKGMLIRGLYMLFMGSGPTAFVGYKLGDEIQLSLRSVHTILSSCLQFDAR